MYDFESIISDFYSSLYINDVLYYLSPLQNEGRMPESTFNPLLLDPANLAARDRMLFEQRVPLLCTR